VRSSGNAGPERDFLYTPELQLHARVDTATETRDTFAWFNGRPIAQINDTATVRYTFTDHLGTPILQTGAAIYTPCPPKTQCPGGGSYSYPVEWRAEYEPYGNIYQLRAGSPDEQPLRLPGQELAWISQSGTEESYNIFRWYRSGWGRYTQADPAGVDASINLYGYVSGRPTAAADPLGLVSSAAECSNCCPPEKMKKELIKSKNWSLVHQPKYVWSPWKVCNGYSCGQSADELRHDLEQNIAPKCWITSTQLIKGGLGGFAHAIAKLFGSNLWPSVHYVVKYTPCNGKGPNYFFDDYLYAKSGELDPADELSSPWQP
jgi:RHS repeat-associated protein